jgi:hypothetical protein
MSAKNKAQNNTGKRIRNKQSSAVKRANPMAPAVAGHIASSIAPATVGMEEANKETPLETYGMPTGIGAAGGALAGIPVALLAHALLADPKKRTLRDYLKSSLLGSLVGGAAGGIGGLGLKAYLNSNPELASSLNKHMEEMKSDSGNVPLSTLMESLQNAYT